MKIQNQLSSSLVISDQLKDGVSQYQSGVKHITLAPNGTAGGGDIQEIPDTIAGESAALAALLADGSLMIIGVSEELGGEAVPGLAKRVLYAANVDLATGDVAGTWDVSFPVDVAVDASGTAVDQEITAATDYVVLVTAVGGVPTIVPRVSTKLVTGFTVVGDATGVVDILAFRIV